MKPGTEKFIKSAAATGDAIRSGQRGPGKLCDKMIEWAELEDGPSTEQMVRHIVTCPDCTAAATVAYLGWVQRAQMLAAMRAMEQAREAN